MATAEAPRQGGDGPTTDQPHEIVLDDDDRYALLDGISAAFWRPADAERLLIMIRFPRNRWPNFDDMTRAWNDVFNDLESGILPPAPFATILRSALRVFSDHPVLRPLAERHGLVAPGRPRAVPDPPAANTAAPGQPVAEQPAQPQEAPPAVAEGCHVIVRANNEEERQHAAAQLSAFGFDPHEVWSTGDAVSYRLSNPHPPEVRERLEQSDLGWTVVAPGEPDYLYQRIYVEGPDARRFGVRGAPAQQTVSNLAGEILTHQYPRPGGASVPITVDHVSRDGETQRVDGESTLHDAGVRDGDTLRVGYQTNAGSVHPDQHRAALERARNQLRAFARSHPGFRVRANGRLPTDYELRFRQRSLGPGGWKDAEPVPIDEHVVLVVLGPEFPRQAPVLWWETPIYHPNVAPNYGDGLRRPQLAGKVCLGLLEKEWQPGRDFGELCQMVIDMAAFRSYGIFRELVADGRRTLAGDFYDAEAALWVLRNQRYIREELGGQVMQPDMRRRVEYPNVIEPVP